MLWPVQKRVRYAAIRQRMADGSEGHRMRRIKGALHAHAAMRAEGRTPGDEGRDAIARNRETRKFAKAMEEKYGPLWCYGRTCMDGVRSAAAFFRPERGYGSLSGS